MGCRWAHGFTRGHRRHRHTGLAGRVAQPGHRRASIGGLARCVRSSAATSRRGGSATRALGASVRSRPRGRGLGREVPVGHTHAGGPSAEALSVILESRLNACLQGAPRHSQRGRPHAAPPERKLTGASCFEFVALSHWRKAAVVLRFGCLPNLWVINQVQRRSASSVTAAKPMTEHSPPPHCLWGRGPGRRVHSRRPSAWVSITQQHIGCQP